MKFIHILYSLFIFQTVALNPSQQAEKLWEWSSPEIPNPPSCYDKGLKQLENGDWESALAYLSKKLRKKSCYDAEIAFTFIDEVINKSARKYYGIAEQLYFQTFSSKSSGAAHNVYETEARRVLPLTPERARKDWERKIKSHDASLKMDIAKFWASNDPVLSTPLNERLIEHWQRISYAREEFTENTESPYGTDERGTVYIQYGEPTFRRKGTLWAEGSQIRSLLYDLSYFKGLDNPAEIFNLQMAIKQQYMPRKYEVWVYRNLGTPLPVLFIFGKSARDHTFGLRKSLEEFLPSDAFRMGISSSWRYDSGPRGISAGPFLQMALYNSLTTIDLYFGDQLSHYERNWLQYMQGNLNFRSFVQMNNSYRAEEDLRRRQREAPDYQSSLKNRLDLIEQTYQLYRFIEADNKPVTKILVFGEADENLIANDKLIFQHLRPSYRLEHVAYLVDDKAVNLYSDEAGLSLSAVDDQPGSNRFAVLTIRADGSADGQKILLGSEIGRVPKSKNMDLSSDSTTRHTIIASATTNFSPPPPLRKDPTAIEVSDLLFGYDNGSVNHNLGNVPFRIPLKPELPRGKNLMIYFEAYHLQEDNRGLHPFQVEYQIHRVKRRRLKDTGIKLTLNFSAENPTARESLEIETSNLKPAKYRATLRFAKNVSAGVPAPVERIVEFEIEK